MLESLAGSTPFFREGPSTFRPADLEAVFLSGDLIAAAAYAAIALVIFRIIILRPVFTFDGYSIVFASIVLGGGLMYLLSAVTRNWSIYGLEAYLELTHAVMAVVGLYAAIKLGPRAMAFVSPEELKVQNDLLKDEIRERESAEVTLRYREAELTNAMERVRCADAAKSAFLAAMSHDLRTPLNAIIGFSDTMRLGVVGDIENRTHREYVELIHASGHNLLRIVDNLLDISRVEHGTFNFTPKTIDAIDICNLAVTEAQAVAAKKDVAVQIDCVDSSLPCVADQSGLHRILSNLLANAVRLSPDGGTVNVMIRATEETITAFILDRGPGFPDGDLDRLRKPFEKAHAWTGGSGLGLAIVSEIVGMHGGKLRLSNRKNGGAVAAVRIPIGEPERTPRERPAPAEIRDAA